MDQIHHAAPQLRVLNTSRDLNGIADLIDICFSAQMDADGREYLRRIRETARNQSSLLFWLSFENGGIPLNGLVWEEDHRIIGNLTLIPFFRDRALNYLIANVAVHPDYRRRGIARQLTERAIEYIDEQGAYSAWLQVRDDNPPAIELYRSLAFVEKARRTTWETGDHFDPRPFNHNVHIQPRGDGDWNLHSRWLHTAYPPEVSWNIPINFQSFVPGFWGAVVRFFKGQELRHLSARFQNKLIGLATWESGANYNDYLWPAVTPEWEHAALPALFEQMKREVSQRRPWQVNYPADRAADVFLEMGFNKVNTLIWMQKVIGKVSI